MGGLPCWKQIIDQNNALQRAVNCMAETIRIAGATGGNLPTDEQAETFQKAAEELAKVAADIEKWCGG